jgi:serine protease
MRPFSRPVAPAALLLALAAGWITTTTAQQADRGRGIKEIVSDISAPGIDRGLRDADVPRPARTSSARRVLGGGAGVEYLRDSLIVRFKPGTLPAAQRALLAQVDATPGPQLSNADFEIVTLAGGDPADVARRLSQQADVEYAQPRYLVHPLFVPTDPIYARQWNFPQIDMERAWDINRGASSDVIVAVVDSGIAFRGGTLRYTGVAVQFEQNGPVFPALGPVDITFAAASDLGTDRYVAPRDFIWGDNLPFDLAGHGTHVAGTIGQLTNNGMGVAGMAFNVRLMPVKVLDSEWDFIFNSPFIGTDDTVARGIRYAVDNGARIINLSLGSEGTSTAPVVRSAMEYAVSHGAFVAVAGGNDGEGRNIPEPLAEIAAQIDGVVAVAATGPDRRRAVYSTVASSIEVAAPGGDFSRGGATAGILQQTLDLDLVETYAGGVARYRAPRFDAFAYYYFEGTSMATAHVSGLAALLMSQGITSPAAIEAILKQSATDLGTPGRDNEFGYGLINARAALRGMGVAR